jgi:hypothetical protein
LLAPQPKSDKKRSESVLDFLKKASMAQDSEKTQPEASLENQAKLEALAKRTGLSLSTLALIQAKEAKVKEGLSIINSEIESQGIKSREQGMIKVADTLRQIMDFKRVNTMFVKDLAQLLNDRQRGVFKSQSKH